MHVAAIEDQDYKHRKEHFWDNVYGIDMRCLSKSTFVEPVVDCVSYEVCASTEDKFFEIDLYTVTKEELQYSTHYELEMMRDDNIHGIITWFDIVFGNMKKEVKFTTGPYDTATHWKQVVFYFNGSYAVKKGDILKGSIACKKSSENFRACDIKISYHMSTGVDSQTLQYKLR
jgi:protein arginine N-methyltransferase 1